jgi:hypothetical protein
MILCKLCFLICASLNSPRVTLVFCEVFPIHLGVNNHFHISTVYWPRRASGCRDRRVRNNHVIPCFAGYIGVWLLRAEIQDCSRDSVCYWPSRLREWTISDRYLFQFGTQRSDMTWHDRKFGPHLAHITSLCCKEIFNERIGSNGGQKIFLKRPSISTRLHGAHWTQGSRVQTRPRTMDFKGDKIRSTPSFEGEVKASVPCRRFTAC